MHPLLERERVTAHPVLSWISSLRLNPHIHAALHRDARFRPFIQGDTGVSDSDVFRPLDMKPIGRLIRKLRSLRTRARVDEPAPDGQVLAVFQLHGKVAERHITDIAAFANDANRILPGANQVLKLDIPHIDRKMPIRNGRRIACDIVPRGHDRHGFTVAPPVACTDAGIEPHVVHQDILDQTGSGAGHDAKRAVALQNDAVADAHIADYGMHVANDNRLGAGPQDAVRYDDFLAGLVPVRDAGKCDTVVSTGDAAMTHENLPAAAEMHAIIVWQDQAVVDDQACYADVLAFDERKGPARRIDDTDILNAHAGAIVEKNGLVRTIFIGTRTFGFLFVGQFEPAVRNSGPIHVIKTVPVQIDGSCLLYTSPS